MLIAQISDLHLVSPKSDKGMLMQTAQHVELAVSHLLAMRPVPSAVLISGDLVDDGTREQYDLLLRLLAPLQGKMPVYLGPGNHDNRETMREVMRAGGYTYLPAEGPLRYTADIGALRLLSLDTLVPGAPGGILREDDLAWLDDALSQDRRPTLIMQHHPPFATGLTRMDSMRLENPEEEARVVARHSHVLCILSGHLHRSIVTRFAGTLAMTAPSCAHAIDLDLHSGGRLAVLREPPAACVHLWQNDKLVTHNSYIGDYGEALVLEP